MLVLCSGRWKIVAAVLCIPLGHGSFWRKERELSVCHVLLSKEASRRLRCFPWSAFAHMQIIKPNSGSEECGYHDWFRIVKSLFLRPMTMWKEVATRAKLDSLFFQEGRNFRDRIGYWIGDQECFLYILLQAVWTEWCSLRKECSVWWGYLKEPHIRHVSLVCFPGAPGSSQFSVDTSGVSYKCKGIIYMEIVSEPAG